MYRFKNKIYSYVEEFLFCIVDFFTKDIAQFEVTRLGSQYGGWWIPNKHLDPDSPRITCISAGIGTDFSFDRAMMELGHSLVGIDPIKQYCQSYIESLGRYERVFVINKALSDSKNSVIISPPKEPSSASWSIKKAQYKEDSDLVVTTQCLQEVIRETREKIPLTEVVILKMDIEGAEKQIIKEIIDSKIKIEWVCIEFDFVALISLRKPFEKFRAVIVAISEVGKLKNLGYKYVLRENSNLYFSFDLGA